MCIIWNQISGKLRRRRRDCGVYFSCCCCDDSSPPRGRNYVIIIIVLYSACRRDISKRPQAERSLPKIVENPSSLRENIARFFGRDTKSRKRFVGQWRRPRRRGGFRRSPMYIYHVQILHIHIHNNTIFLQVPDRSVRFQNRPSVDTDNFNLHFSFDN